MLDLLSPLNFFKQSEHLKKNFLFRKWGPEKVGQDVEMLRRKLWRQTNSDPLLVM